MNKIYRIFRSIHRYVWIGLLSLLLATTIVPVVASEVPKVAVVDASRLLVKGKAAYEAGRFTEASKYWHRAEQVYSQQGDRDFQALSLNYLSLAHRELGDWDTASQQISQSLKLIKEQPETGILAQILNTQGSLQLAQGDAQGAIASWQQATEIYRQTQDEIGVIGSQINQAQALQQLGLIRRSHKILEELQTQLKAETDPQLKALGLRSLGNALQVVGNLEESQAVLKSSLELTQSLDLTEETSQTLFSLGNTARALQSYDMAIAFYEQAAARTSEPITKTEAQLNQLSLLTNLHQLPEAQAIIPEIKANLGSLAPNRRTIYARVNLANNLLDLEEQNSTSASYIQEAENLLAQTINQARHLQDNRAYSYALGTLGHLYEQKQQDRTAQKITEKALNIALNLNATDIAYQWQWQLGRLHQKQGNISQAIALESAAVDSLQAIRSDLAATNLDAQYSFRESVEPIYRDLVRLLLSADGDRPSQEHLVKAREVIESLQLAELENYFREACIDAQPKQIDQVDEKAAVIYPIILPDRLSVIMALPGQPLDYYQTNISQAEVEQTLEGLFQALNPVFSNKKRLGLSQQVYDWLIKPAETKLAAQDIETIVFVLDGSLRNLPMAALYDGKQYLIEKYGVALTPGLQLLEPEKLAGEQLEAVVAGVSESIEGFVALPGVKAEMQDISAIVPSQLLLNQEFTSQNLKQQLQKDPFPLVHLATHGQFSSNPEETFIVTWGGRIKVKDFEGLLRAREESIDAKPIELLVLSACQTAEGDKRAALGIAGIAVRSGARSTLATLWSVKDDSTVKLMDKFYQQLVQADSSSTKAKALREAQIALMHSDNFNHPFYWAPFILVGNWL